MGKARRKEMKDKMVSDYRRKADKMLFREKQPGPVSPFNREIRDVEDSEFIGEKERREEIEKVQQNRSEKARKIDRQYNAPVTDNVEKWKENPNRYDLAGVDTIPSSIRKTRADQAGQKAQEKDFLDKIEFKGNAKRLKGKFSPKGTKTYGRNENIIRVQKNTEDKGRVLAHEIGHAISRGAGDQITHSRIRKISNKLFVPKKMEKEGKLRNEAKELSERMRGKIKGSAKHRKYRRKDEELVADFFSSAIIEPRATKREAPNLFERVNEELKESGTSISEITEYGAKSEDGKDSRRFF